MDGRSLAHFELGSVSAVTILIKSYKLFLLILAKEIQQLGANNDERF